MTREEESAQKLQFEIGAAGGEDVRRLVISLMRRVIAVEFEYKALSARHEALCECYAHLLSLIHI
jgi:hypothetical protein